MVGDDVGEAVLFLLDEDEEAMSSAFAFGCFELLDEEKMDLNMIATMAL